MNLAGHSSRNPTPLMSRRTQPQAMPTLTLNEASPSPSTENSPMISRSRSSSTNNDLRKQVLLSQSGQLRNNTSAVNLITNQVWSYLLILFGLLPVSLAECSDTASGAVNCAHYLQWMPRIGHVNEHPSMHCLGIPRHAQSMIAYKILTESFWKFQ